MNEKFELLLREWRKNIDTRLLETVDGRHPRILYEPIEYVFQGGGKRIRPILLVMACKATGGQVESCWDAAVAVELLHNFTLVHDDIMDQDDRRRGRLTVHKKWSPDIALLAGDGLVALAFQSLLRTQTQRSLEIAKIFTDGIVELCEGQALDLEFERRSDVSVEEYLGMIGRKTARLLNISAKIGALIADGSSAEVQAVGDFGYNLGCAFQIQDDLLDITSDEVTLGKTYGSDVKRKKQTYLLIHARTHGSSANKVHLRALLSQSEIDAKQINEVKSIFQEAGSIAAAKTAIERYLFSARNNLIQLQSTQGRALLSDFLDYIAARNA